MLQFFFSLRPSSRTGWLALGAIVLGSALCLGNSVRAEALDDAAALTAPGAIERIEIGKPEREGLPNSIALLGVLPSDEILRRENSAFRIAALRHSKFRTLRGPKNDLPAGQRRYWLDDLGVRLPSFARPSLQILFCCWLV